MQLQAMGQSGYFPKQPPEYKTKFGGSVVKNPPVI